MSTHPEDRPALLRRLQGWIRRICRRRSEPQTAKPCTAVQIRSSPSLVNKPRALDYQQIRGSGSSHCSASRSVRRRHVKSACCRAGCRAPASRLRCARPTCAARDVCPRGSPKLARAGCTSASQERSGGSLVVADVVSTPGGGPYDDRSRCARCRRPGRPGRWARWSSSRGSRRRSAADGRDLGCPRHAVASAFRRALGRWPRDDPLPVGRRDSAARAPPQVSPGPGWSPRRAAHERHPVGRGHVRHEDISVLQQRRLVARAEDAHGGCARDPRRRPVRPGPEDGPHLPPVEGNASRGVIDAADRHPARRRRRPAQRRDLAPTTGAHRIAPRDHNEPSPIAVVLRACAGNVQPRRARTPMRSATLAASLDHPY